MSNPRDELRSIEESIRHDAALVKELEDRKASLDPGDPVVDQLSLRIERLAQAMQGKAAAERELSEEIKTTR
jgi:hypothetical protein